MQRVRNVILQDGSIIQLSEGRAGGKRLREAAELCPEAWLPKATKLTHSYLSMTKHPATVSNFAITKSFLTRGLLHKLQKDCWKNSKLLQDFHQCVKKEERSETLDTAC